MRTRRALKAAWLLAIPGAYAAWIWFRVPLYFGMTNWWRVSKPDSVQLYRIDPARERHGAIAVEEMAVAGPISPTEQWVYRLISLIGDSRNYGWDFAKACSMTPGVAVRFHRNGSTTDVKFCFECKMLSMAKSGEPGRAEDFDPINDELTALMQEALPKDPVIQSLTVDHHLKGNREERR